MIYQLDIIKEKSGKKLFTLTGDFGNKKEALRCGERLIEFLKIEGGHTIVSYGLSNQIIEKLNQIIELIGKEQK